MLCEGCNPILELDNWTSVYAVDGAYDGTACFLYSDLCYRNGEKVLHILLYSGLVEKSHCGTKSMALYHLIICRKPSIISSLENRMLLKCHNQVFLCNHVMENGLRASSKVPPLGKTDVELLDSRTKRTAIIINEIPYQTNKVTLVEKIAEHVENKEVPYRSLLIFSPDCITISGQDLTTKSLEGISDIRDESDRTGMRVVIELKRGSEPSIVLNNLYRLTALQSSFNCNMVGNIVVMGDCKQVIDCLNGDAMSPWKVERVTCKVLDLCEKVDEDELASSKVILTIGIVSEVIVGGGFVCERRKTSPLALSSPVLLNTPSSPRSFQSVLFHPRARKQTIR
ncbi:hypothetical protein Ancab_027030 [Ancistrocladus abbreviatus]